MKAMRKFWKLVFGRTGILVLLMLIQAVVLFGGFILIDSRTWVINYAISILAIVILIYIMNARTNPSFKLMWIILILLVPVVGVVFYLYTRMQPGTAYIAKRVSEIVSDEERYLRPSDDTLNSIRVESRQEYGFAEYLYRKGKYPVYDGSGIKYFPLGEDQFEELLYQLSRAEKFIFLEYFILERGHMWNEILKILIRKVREGVEVRLIYDGTCTLSLLPKNYPAKMRKHGIKCKVFSPMTPFLSTHQNNRDHRKIVVIDGNTAFTGGINIADEYINRKKRFGHWKDTGVMVQGRAVDSFTLMFLQMWNIDEKGRENYDRYMQRYPVMDAETRKGGYVAPYGDSPFDNEEVGEKVYLDIINRSRDYVHIMTPYLIIDEEMINALIFAAQRGVEVKLVLPHIPDKKYAYLLARTYYEELIREGVEIYEYTPGFVHAKVFSCDDERAVVGTINLDYRSLYLHFECAVYMWKNPAISDIEMDFYNTLKKCRRISVEDCRKYSPLAKAAGMILRLVAPLM